MHNYYKKTTFHLTLICCLCCATGLIYNGLTPRGLPLLHHAAVLPENTELSPRQAYLAYRAGNAVFIDTRSEAEFKSGHIRNAINIPSEATREEIMNFLRVLEQDEEMIVYCSSKHCDSARRLAGFIKYIGYIKVNVFTDGFDVWREHRFPVEIQDSQ
jgi:rhodanese-related sulfurtransferase